MIILKEFLNILERGCHYRIYEPNRDCLIFESYFTVHSTFDIEEDLLYSKSYNENYYTNNDYCYNVYDTEPDLQTRRLVEKYGDYKVSNIEVSGVRPMQFRKDSNGRLQLTYVADKYKPSSETVDCVNIFIHK